MLILNLRTRQLNELQSVNTKRKLSLRQWKWGVRQWRLKTFFLMIVLLRWILIRGMTLRSGSVWIGLLLLRTGICYFLLLSFIRNPLLFQIIILCYCNCSQRKNVGSSRNSSGSNQCGWKMRDGGYCDRGMGGRAMLGIRFFYFILHGVLSK